MGYSHGKKWTLENIKKEISQISKTSEYMPSCKTMDEYTGNKGLSNAVCRNGGCKKIAEMMNLKTKESETEYGRNYELYCLNKIGNIFHYDCEKMTTKYPYDLIVDRSVKIDVKASRKVKCRDSFSFSFNLEKKNPTCDIFVFFCIDNDKIIKTYIIPSCILSGKCQLSVGIKQSIYDVYLDRWDYIKEYVCFMRKIKNE